MEPLLHQFSCAGVLSRRAARRDWLNRQLCNQRIHRRALGRVLEGIGQALRHDRTDTVDRGQV